MFSYLRMIFFDLTSFFQLNLDSIEPKRTHDRIIFYLDIVKRPYVIAPAEEVDHGGSGCPSSLHFKLHRVLTNFLGIFNAVSKSQVLFHDLKFPIHIKVPRYD